MLFRRCPTEVTQQFAAGQAHYDNAGLGPASSPPSSHTCPQVRKTAITRAPAGGHPPHISKTVTYNDYPSVLVCADGYPGVGFKARPGPVTATRAVGEPGPAKETRGAAITC
ncbi:MAG TPA: hypothetical protein VFQ44_15405 [Streptosporangiaceae bacterium]|nr:hypothetical protein [Streptosporangiaceae bacterium]